MTDYTALPRDEIFARLAGVDLDAVLWLGAGEASAAELAALDARQLRLVEPDPSRAEALRRAAQDLPGAEVIEAAAAQQTGRGVLLRYNLSAANALRAPSGLRDLFPNLHQTGALEVDTLDMDGLLKDMDLPQGTDHLLILEAPGEAAGLLGALADGGLKAFSHILLTLPPEPLYDGEAPGAELQAQLRAVGFVPEALDASDPDRPLAYLARDKARLALEAEREQWHARYLEAEEAARALRGDLEAQSTKAAQEISAARAQVTALETSRDETAAKHSAAQAKLTAERDEARQTAKRLRAQVESLQAQTGSIETLQDNLGVALRMQALREADLAELRSRYSAQTRETAALDQALRDVAQNVQIALNYLEAQPAPEQVPDQTQPTGPARRRAARKAAAAQAKPTVKPAARKTAKEAAKAPAKTSQTPAGKAAPETAGQGAGPKDQAKSQSEPQPSPRAEGPKS